MRAAKSVVVKPISMVFNSSFVTTPPVRVFVLLESPAADVNVILVASRVSGETASEKVRVKKLLSSAKFTSNSTSSGVVTSGCNRKENNFRHTLQVTYETIPEISVAACSERIASNILPRYVKHTYL